MEEKTSVRDKGAELVKRTSYFYRLAIVTLFKKKTREFRVSDGHPFGSLKGIIQEMGSFYDGYPDDLKGSFSKKLDNIISGRTEGARYEDVEHFLLIEQFLLHHAPEELSKINLKQQLLSLANILDEFWGGRLQQSFGQPVTGVQHLYGVESESIYEIDFIQFDGDLNNRKEQSHYDIKNGNRYCIATKSIDNSKYELAILFRESEIPALHFGVYLKEKSYFVFRSFRHKQPMCLYLDYPEKGNKTLRSTASILPERISNDLSGKEIVYGINPYQIRLNEIANKSRRLQLIKIANSYISGLELEN